MNRAESFRIFRAEPAHRDDVRCILDAYCDEIGVVVRDAPEDLDKYFAEKAGVWLVEASRDDAKPTIVGCVALRPLVTRADAGEVKRLYVERAHRGVQLAARLMDALHAYARACGYAWLYLDSKDDLVAAIKLYERLGYAHCARYNDNPQATVFMRRALPAH